MPNFLNSHVLLTNINRFESLKLLHETFFLESPNTLPTLSHIQNTVM